MKQPCPVGPSWFKRSVPVKQIGRNTDEQRTLRKNRCEIELDMDYNISQNLIQLKKKLLIFEITGFYMCLWGESVSNEIKAGVASVQRFHSDFFHLVYDVARYGQLWPNIIFI